MGSTQMAIKLYITLLIFLSGMISYAAIHHCTIDPRPGRRRVHLLFAGLSLLMALFILSTIQTFQTATVNDFIQGLRLNLSIYALFLALFPWFFSEYAVVRPKIVLVGLTGLAAVLFLVNLIQPYTIIYKEILGLTRVTLPWGEEIILPGVIASNWFYIGVIALFADIAFGFYSLAVRFRQDRRRTALFMMLALGLFMAGTVTGILYRLGIAFMPPLGPFGYMSMIIVMGLTLNYEIQNERRQMQAILDHVPALIFMKNPKGQYMMINRHFEALFHVSIAKMYGRTDHLIFPKEQADALYADEQQALAMRQPLECEEIITTNREPHTYISIKFPLFHADGTPFAICGISTDITRRKLAELALKQSEARYQRLYNETPVMLHSIDRDARVVEVNDYWLKTMGYERSEVIGRKVTDFYTEASRKYAQAVTQPAFLKDGIAKDLSYQFVKKSGEVLEVLLSATAERDAAGNVVRSQAVIEDTTKWKQAEAAVRESEERFRSLSNATLVGIMIHDQGVILDANMAFVRLFGYDQPDELIGKNGLELILTLESRARISRRIQRQETGPLEVTCIRKDGTTFVAETDSQPAKYRGHDARIVSCRDITERKKAEEALRESEIKFRAVFENSRDAIGIAKKGMHFFANPAFLKLFGHESNEDFAGTSILDDIAPSHHPQMIENMRRRAAGEPIPPIYITRGRKADGTEFDMEVIASTYELQGEIYTIANIRDITERRLIEEERERLTVAIEQAGEAVVVTDAQGTIQYVNPMFETVTGYTRAEAVGQNPRILKSGKHDIAFYLELWDTITSGRVWQGRFINRKKDGSLYTEDATISPVNDNAGRIVNYVAVKRDITEQLRAVEEKTRLEDQLRQAQKMESIGTLAGGIAHDFNNILSAIIGYGNLALMKMAKDDPQRLNIEHMLDAGNRAAHLTKDLLLFSRKQSSERKPIDLNDVIRKVETFLKRVIGEDIECKTTHFAGVLPILGDAHQLEQVLMNFATNARDAMPMGGVFSITTEQMKFDNEFLSVDGYSKPGNYALIIISDTGKGMDEVTRAHIFEPFFTTKEVGKGTGLGLAVVYGIIKQHEGAINVFSEPGVGTTFQIYLPLISVLEHETISGMVERPAGGTEIVLLAEDDENVRNLTRTVLEDFGYQVIIAHDGQDAVNKYKESKEKIQLLLFDIVMPKKTGKEAYDDIKAMTPGVKVLFLSGYAPDVVRQRVLIDDGMPVVNKPISPAELLRKVREMLDSDNCTDTYKK
jgi:PAS domain S-box-containing protein